MIGERYFSIFPEIYTVLVRFDLLRSVSEAHVVGTGNAFTFSGYISKLIQAVGWSYGTNAQTVGQAWATEISASAAKTSSTSGVSFSQSYLAEGWLLAGFTGVAFLSITVAAMTFLFCKLAEKQDLFGFISLGVISSTAVYEGSLLFILEALSNSAKSAILFYFLFSLLVTKNRSKGRRFSRQNKLPEKQIQHEF
jgi:hypothetical protein